MISLPERILYASHNPGKIEEMAAILAGSGAVLTSARALGLRVPLETEETFEGNARLKAEAAFAATGLPSLADDSGLCIDALDGAPGVYTADWAETESGRDFGVAMRRVWESLKAAGAAEPWRARFVCVLAYVASENECRFFRGEVEGSVVWPPRGRDGHGYDPIFVPSPGNVTFAEMPLEQKNALSHRFRAAQAFLAGCFT